VSDVRINWRYAFAAAVGLILLFTIQNYSSPVVQRGQSFGRTLVLQTIVWGTWLILSPLIFRIAQAWRRQPQRTTSGVVSQLLISFGVALLHPAIAGTIRWSLDLSVYDDLPEVILASMVSSLAANMLRYWAIAMVYHAVAYHREVVAREGALGQARLDSLQGRLHPHFLFNTLNSIGALIRERPGDAEHMLGSLSELLRASLNAEPSREVTLERELDLLHQYVSIQQLRFQDRLTVSVEASPDLLSAYVPHLVLQPLVENAIRHGIAPREAPGHVRIAAGRTDGRLRLVVEDDGIGMHGRKGSGFGLSGTEARLRHLYGAAARLDIQARTPTGIVATIEVPFHTMPIAQEAHA